MYPVNTVKPIKAYTEIEFETAKSRDLLSFKCNFCEKLFGIPKNRVQATRIYGLFCSSSCKNKYVKDKTMQRRIVQCDFCKKEFSKTLSEIKNTKHNFCCRSHAAIYNNAHKTKGTTVSKLEVWIQTKLTEIYSELEFHFNRRDAIKGELDIYIPLLKLAFELNGIFHYEPIFGKDKLDSIQNNDCRKYQACIEHGIELCILDVSHERYFKEEKSIKFLEIIKNIIDNKLEH